MANWCKMKIRQIKAIPFLLLLTLNACAQHTTPDEFQQRIDYCTSNFPDELISLIKKELSQLENHFIESGLLADNSGESYHNVYKRIAETNSFDFQTNISLNTLDSLDQQTIRTCFFRLLTEDQLTNVNQHHLEVANNITKGLEGNITIGTIAQRYVDLLTPEDFELAYFKHASLRGFYEMSKPRDGILSVLPKYNANENAAELLQINLNEKSRVLVNGNIVDNEELPNLVRNFIQADPINRAVSINPTRDASYESYIAMLEAVNKPFNELREEMAKREFQLSFSELAPEQQREIEKSIPRNIIMNEPK